MLACTVLSEGSTHKTTNLGSLRVGKVQSCYELSNAVEGRVGYDYAAAAVVWRQINKRLHQLLPGLLAGIGIWDVSVARPHVPVVAITCGCLLHVVSHDAGAAEQVAVTVISNNIYNTVVSFINKSFKPYISDPSVKGFRDTSRNKCHMFSQPSL